MGPPRDSAPNSGSGSPASPDPHGGTEDKPVGLAVPLRQSRDGRRITRSTRSPGDRADVRDRSTTVAMHLLAEIAQGAKGRS